MVVLLTSSPLVVDARRVVIKRIQQGSFELDLHGVMPPRALLFHLHHPAKSPLP